MMKRTILPATVSRRSFVAMIAGAVGACLSSTLFGANYREAERGSRVGWCRLKFPGLIHGGRLPDWSSHPTGDIKLIRQIRRATNINLMRD